MKRTSERVVDAEDAHADDEHESPEDDEDPDEEAGALLGSGHGGGQLGGVRSGGSLVWQTCKRCFK